MLVLTDLLEPGVSLGDDNDDGGGSVLMEDPSGASADAIIKQHTGPKWRKQKTILRFRYIQVERYQEDQMRQIKATVPALGLRRKTLFFGFLLMIAQLAYVDTCALLPVGMILYSIGIGLVIELLEAPEEDYISPSREEIFHQIQKGTTRRKEQKLWEEWRRLQDMVDFEYQFLQGRTIRPGVVAREERGRLVYYLV